MFVFGILILGAALIFFMVALGLFSTQQSAAGSRLSDLKSESTQRSIDLTPELEYGFFYRFTPRSLIERTERNTVLAGRPDGWDMARFLTRKVVLGAAGLGIGLVLVLSNPSTMAYIILLVLPVLGYLYPDIRLNGQAVRRQEEIQYELPELLDQIIISIESGLSFESALRRISYRTTGPLAEEGVRTVQDIALGVPRREAYMALVSRTDVDELRKFVRAILQGEEFGVPMAEVVRDQAAEMRVSRQLRAEGKANEVPVKMLFPLVFCILPVLFIVIIGPSVIGIMEVF